MSNPQQPIGGRAGDKPGIAENDLKTIQGDILVGMAKKLENFIFFSIKDSKAFRTQLSSFKSQITTAEQARQFRERIKKADELQINSAINIAFSAKGLKALDPSLDITKINDTPFVNGQLQSAKDLGDDISKWDPLFSGKSDELKDKLHGVIIVVASDPSMLKGAMDNVTKTFRIGQQNASITIAPPVEGKVRASEEGHEHFGFKDGITQPMIDGLGEITSDKMDSAAPIAPGVILLGRRGDLKKKKPTDKEPTPTERPPWALDGSFMVFRKLEQHVPEFNADIQKMADSMGLNPDVLGARLVGRWKSGAPVQSTSNQNKSTSDPVKKGDIESSEATSQKITFSINDQKNCPFAAHIRKTNPREDRPVSGVAPHRILRRGIQYGDDVGPGEKTTSLDPKKQRGLLFVCYQSNIENGFEFIQNSWVSSTSFPFPSKDVVKDGQPGVDPLIGTPTPKSQRFMRGANPSKLDDQTDLQKMDWVVSKGGEYFFSPSITALDSTPFA